MKTLKMKSFKAIGFFVIFFWGIAIFFACLTLPSLLTSFKEPIPWESVDFSSDIDGLYVSGTVYGIYDWYCEEYADNKLDSREYVINADSYYYMGMRTEGEDMNAANALMDATHTYLSGEDDGTQLLQMQYEIKGVIKPIPAESLELYYDYLGWTELDEETKNMFLPYYIDVNKFGAYNSEEITVMLVVLSAFFLLGCIFLILASTGRYQKSVKRYIESSTNSDMARERIEYFIKNTPEVNGLRYNSDFICGQSNGTTAFGETSKLAWVYLHTISHKRYFITIRKSYALMLCFTDGSKQAAQVKNETIAQEHMQKLSQFCPQTIFGYTDELDKLFSKDRAAFLQLRYNNADTINNNL